MLRASGSVPLKSNNLAVSIDAAWLCWHQEIETSLMITTQPWKGFSQVQDTGSFVALNRISFLAPLKCSSLLKEVVQVESFFLLDKITLLGNLMSSGYDVFMAWFLRQTTMRLKLVQCWNGLGEQDLYSRLEKLNLQTEPSVNLVSNKFKSMWRSKISFKVWFFL